MPRNAVIDHMCSLLTRLCCSERMYKHQFKKWNWTKYKAKDHK